MNKLKRQIDAIDRLYAEFHENAYRCTKKGHRRARVLSVKIAKMMKDYRKDTKIWDKAL